MAKNKKDLNDKFYTKIELSKYLINLINVSKYDVVIEPSAGNGSFFNQIEHQNKIGLDLVPESDNIIEMDWFNFNLNENYINSLVIGNPPFGNQGSIALKFIKKCDDLNINTIAFILPKSFKKDSFKIKIPTKYHLTMEFDIDDNSFTLNGNDYNVPCVFQVWERRSEDREVKKLKTNSSYFQFVKKSENPDYAFRRVGFYAGNIYEEYTDKSEQSHYFIKSNNKIKDIIKNIKWIHNNTTGPRSIGKSEIIKKVEDSLKKVSLR
jgi:hypothetical protein